MSHLACADGPDQAMNAEQLQGFNQRRAMLPGAPASSRTPTDYARGPPYDFELVRPAMRSMAGGRRGRADTLKPVVPSTSVSCRSRTSGPRRHHWLFGAIESRGALAHRHHRRRLCRRLPARPERGSTGEAARRLHRRLSGAHRRPRVDGLHHRRRHQRAAGAGRRGAWVEVMGHRVRRRPHRRAGTIGYELLSRLGRACIASMSTGRVMRGFYSGIVSPLLSARGWSGE